MPLDANDAANTSDAAIDDLPLDNTSGDAAASSPAATTPSDDDGLPNIVRDVIDARAKKEEPPADSQSAETKPDAAAEDGADEADPEPPPFHTHPAWKRMLTQRNNARGQRDDFKARFEAQQKDVEDYGKVNEFIASNGLSADEAANMLIIAGLINTNPVEAWKQMRPTVEAVMRAAGEILPADLVSMVSEGKVDKETALMLSRQRAAIDATKRSQTFQDQRRQADVSRQAQDAIANAVGSWYDERKGKDPNFASKQEALEARVLYLNHKHGKPTDPLKVVARLNDAYKDVNASLPKAAPKPNGNGQRPVVSNPAPAAARAAPQPAPKVETKANEIAEGSGTMAILKGVLSKSRGQSVSA